MRSKFTNLSICTIALFISACASSVDRAAPEEDLNAKQFKSISNKAVLYLVQNGGAGSYRANFLVFIDGQVKAGLSGNTYRRLELNPGRYTLLATSPENQKTLTISAIANEIIFVGAKSTGGWTQMRISEFESLNQQEGKQAVREAVLAKEIE
jgi:hypothetical protein